MPNIDKSHFWESLAIDIDPGDLVDAVAQAEDNEDKERIEALLCGAVKLLRNNRAKPDQVRCSHLNFFPVSLSRYLNQKVIHEMTCIHC